jgi:pimeloyl-ACP methyl ester carboxylesterase
MSDTASTSTPSESGYVPVGPLQMYYEVRGEGPPLVLLHGGGSGIDATFGRIVDRLAAKRRVIGLEQQGHGHTADVDRPFSFEQMADDTADALESLGVERADVFGFSNGGQVALQLAIRHPERIRKLVVAAAPYRNDGMIPELLAAFSVPVTVDDVPPGLRDSYRAVAPDPDHLPTFLAKGQQLMRTLEDWPDADLAALSMPVLLLIGDRDIVRPEHAVAMMRLIPGSRLVILPGVHGAYIGEASTPIEPSPVHGVTVTLVDDFLAADD